MAAETGKPPKPWPTIWDWPLRLWHWAFAALLVFSLATGLIGDIGLMDWHQRSGLALLGLLAFRLGWAAWGGLHARWRWYWTTPAAFIDHFRGHPGNSAHTSPGIALALLLFAAAALQVTSGLFASDDIFVEGPLHGLASEGLADAASWLHHRLHWLIIAAIGVHLLAHAIYGFALRDPTPLAMFTGRKPLAATPATPHFWLRAAGTVALAAGVVFAVDNAERWFG